MKIELLADHSEAIPVLARWYRMQWEPFYGADGPGDAVADLRSRCNRGETPIGLVAVDRGRVRGTIALDLDVTTNLTPSIVGLLVAQEFRKRGIAAALIAAAEDVARELGYDRLYVSTTVLGAYLRRKSWRKSGDVEFLNAEGGSVYVRDL